jgi:hypothetical protein
MFHRILTIIVVALFSLDIFILLALGGYEGAAGFII